MENPELQALQKQAREAIKSRRLGDAQAFLKKAIVLDQSNVTTWLLVTYAYSENPQRQQEALRRAKRIAPTDPRVLKRETEILPQSTVLPPVPIPDSAVKPTTTSGIPDHSSSARRVSIPLWLPGIAVVVILVAVGVIALSGSHNAPNNGTIQSTATSVIAVAPSSMPESTTSASSTVNDPVISTATALVQQMTATGQTVLNAQQAATHTAQTTQTATLQGALALTVAAQQSSIAALAALRGTIIINTDNQYNIVSTKLEFLAQSGKAIQSVAPDGKHFLYADTRLLLHVAGINGSDDHQVSSQQLSGGTWSPDSQKVAFFGQNQTLSIISLADTTLKALTPDGMVVSQARWSPDSHRLVFVGQLSQPGKPQTTAIYVAETDGPAGNAHAVTTFDTMGQASPLFQYDAPQWFPDSQQILFSAHVKTGSNTARVWAILSIYADGTNQTVIHTFTTNEPVAGTGLSLSPSGKAAYFYATDPRNSKQNLYLMPVKSGTFQKVVEVGYQSVAAPAWSPDGRYLAGQMTAQVQTPQLYVANADSAGLLPIQLDTSHLYPLFVWAPDSQALVTCYFDNNSGVQTGAMILISISDPGKPVVLVDKPICPSLWTP